MSPSTLTVRDPAREHHASDAQMNVRIERTLRDSGNAALAEIGLSPSSAVRKLWGKAAKGGNDLREVKGLLLPDPENDDGPSDTFGSLEAGRTTVSELLLTMGAIAEGSDIDDRPFEDLKAAAYREQLLEEAEHE